MTQPNRTPALGLSLNKTAPAMPITSTRRIITSALVMATLMLLAMSAVLGYRVISNFDEVQPRASDNVIWSLSQVEVDASDFNNAVKDAMLSSESSLSKLRLRFDILYSRVSTLSASAHYRRVDEISEFSTSLKEAWAFLQKTVPVIDGPDSELRAALPALRQEGAALREHTRIMSVSGLSFFVQNSDESRAAISRMLLQFAVLAVMLVTTLAALAIYVLSIYRKSRQRGVALQQANRRMQTILTTSLDGVIVTDVQGHVLEFNAAAERTLGYTFEQVRGRSIIEMISPDNMLATHLAGAQRIRNRDPDTIEGKGRVTLNAKRANGDVFPVELSIQRADDGDQELFVAFLHDISKRVAAESELLETRDRALAGERAKAEFLTVMSHEIRTPLNGLLGNLALLKDTNPTKKQTRYLRNMDISGRVLMRHVDSVLDIARFQSGKLDFEIARTNLSTLLDDLIDSQIGSAEQQGTVLKWQWVGDRMPWAYTDRAALEQVLLNLLGNAIKFTPNGTVSVEIEKLPEHEADMPTLELRVIDTGVGIPEIDLERVFDDFVTSDTSFGRATGGTGLGLGITRRIVQGLGGKIGVESALGEGSTFWVRLPMQESQPPGDNAHPDAPIRLPKQMMVLLVEDNDINREVACELLEKDGHIVVTAPDGQTGIDHADAARFDLILMDIAMPGLDGLQATRAIRSQDGASRAVPIIAVSANILPEERDRFLAAGMNGFLAKPLDLDEMRDALSNIDRPAALLSNAVLDTEQLTANRAGMGHEMFDRLLARFIAEVDDLVADVEILNGEALDALGCRLHTVAGSAAVFGAAKLRKTLLEAEVSANQFNRRDTRRLLDLLPDIWHDTKTALMELTHAA